jgi:hypothetical protein
VLDGDRSVGRIHKEWTSSEPKSRWSINTSPYPAPIPHNGTCDSLAVVAARRLGQPSSNYAQVIPALDDRRHFARTLHSGATHAIAISMGFTGSLWRNLKLGARFLRGAQDPTQDLCAYYRGCRWAGASGTHSRS